MVGFEARVIFRWLSVDSLSTASVRTFVSSLHVQMLRPSVAFSCSVSTCTMKRQQTMLSFLSSNKSSRRVEGKLYNNFRDKQNKAYVLVTKKQPIARNGNRSFRLQGVSPTGRFAYTVVDSPTH